MKSARRFLARSGALIGAIASLLVCVSAAPGAADPVVPTVHVSTESAQIGQLVQITGTGWSPVGQTVQIELCGQDAQNLSEDCDQTHQYTAAIRAGGVFYGALVTYLPPSPCPCVVAVTTQGSFSAVDAPITIRGARTVPVRSHSVPPAPVTVSGKVDSSLSPSSWFGGPRSVTLVLRITNVSSIAFGTPTLTVNVGRGRNPSGFVVGEPLAPLAVGATEVLRIPVTLPAFTAGGYSVRAQVITGQGEVATVVRTSSYPWGLFVVAALLLQAALLFIRNRVRARLRGPIEPDGPEQAVEEDVLQPVSVIDLRTTGTHVPAAGVGEEVQPSPVPVIDLRTSSLPPAGWATTNRLALTLPGQSLTCSVEVSACPGIRIQRTTVRAWADFSASPWDALHEASSWAEMADGSPSNPLSAEGHFSYDSRILALELHVTARGPRLRLGDDRLVLPVRVEGTITLNGEQTPLDIETTLEQVSYTDSADASLPADLEPQTGPLTYGHAAGGDSFYLGADSGGSPEGWLMRGGLAARSEEHTSELQSR